MYYVCLKVLNLAPIQDINNDEIVGVMTHAHSTFDAVKTFSGRETLAPQASVNEVRALLLPLRRLHLVPRCIL